MNFKKLKLATGIVGLVGVLLAAFCYIFSVAYAGKNDGGPEMLGVAVLFITIGIPFGVAAIVEFIFSIIYIIGKIKARAFYVAGGVLSVLNAFICFVLVYFAILITKAIGGFVIPIITALCALPVITAIILKILCAVKFKKEDNKE